jgi:hypothetical protein
MPLGDRSGEAGPTDAPTVDARCTTAQSVPARQLCAEKVVRAIAKVLNRAGASPYLSVKFRPSAECSGDGEIVCAFEAKPGWESLRKPSNSKRHSGQEFR